MADETAPASPSLKSAERQAAWLTVGAVWIAIAAVVAPPAPGQKAPKV